MKNPPIPGEITRLVAQERVRRHLGARVNVFVRDQFSFALSAEVVFKHGLKPGLILSAAQISALLLEDGEEKALVTARNFLSFRPRSREEVRKRLQKDEWEGEVIERVLARLEKANLLNDAQFATLWVENRGLSKPRGSHLLKAELRQKGVEKDAIAEALPDEDGEIHNATFLLEKSARKLEKYEGRELEQKAIQLLARRGFGFGVAKTAFKNWQESEE